MELQVIEAVFKYFAIINVILGGFGLVFIVALLSTKKVGFTPSIAALALFVNSAVMAIITFFYTLNCVGNKFFK